MNRFRKLGRFIYRMDNFNRVIVFVSMCLFLFLPSTLLYYTKSDNYSFFSVMACVMMIGISIGNGLFVLLRPLKTTWFYFFALVLMFLFLFQNCDFTIIPYSINVIAIFIISLCYCILGFAINLVYLLYYVRRKTKSEMNENTNNDTIFDFLGGNKKNKAVSDKLDELTDYGTFADKAKKKISGGKFSRFMRIFSFAVSCICCIYYFAAQVGSVSITKNIFAINLLLILLLLTLALVASLLYPVEFKYIYYFNALFLLITSIISAGENSAKPFFLILSVIMNGLSFLLTLIVEGRIWTGSDSD